MRRAPHRRDDNRLRGGARTPSKAGCCHTIRAPAFSKPRETPPQTQAAIASKHAAVRGAAAKPQWETQWFAVRPRLLSLPLPDGSPRTSNSPSCCSKSIGRVVFSRHAQDSRPCCQPLSERITYVDVVRRRTLDTFWRFNALAAEGARVAKITQSEAGRRFFLRVIRSYLTNCFVACVKTCCAAADAAAFAAEFEERRTAARRRARDEPPAQGGNGPACANLSTTSPKLTAWSRVTTSISSLNA